MLPTCGDGVIDTGEECDDMNTNGGDGCSADCLNEGEALPECVIDFDPALCPTDVTVCE